MKTLAHVVGIDPGLVHTGCVRMVFDVHARALVLSHAVITGLDVDNTKAWVKAATTVAQPHIFIEAYRPRHNLSPDQKMVAAVSQLHQALPASIVLPNTGVKRVVPAPLMALLDVLDWPQSTHHQDLRSAARIALLGMMKDTDLNRVLSATVSDHLDGHTWKVTRR